MTPGRSVGWSGALLLLLSLALGLSTLTDARAQIVTYDADDSFLFAPSPMNAVDTTDNATLALPLDLYLLIDTSRSISTSAQTCRQATKAQFPPNGITCWQLIVRFARNIVSMMAELAGGYAQIPQDGGIRVSLYTFSCQNGNPRTVNVLTGPTGDEALIATQLSGLSSATLVGQTCPSQGLQRIKDEIVANAEIEPRPSAVIFLTDGITDAVDRPKSQNQAQSIRAQNQTSMFAISLGTGGDGATNFLTNLLGGDRSRLFPARNPSTLETLANILAAIMLGSWTPSFIPPESLASEAAPYLAEGTPNPGAYWCRGRVVPIALGSRAAVAIGPASLTCNMTVFRNNAYQPSIMVQARYLTGDSSSPIVCDYPASFYPDELVTVALLQGSGNNRVSLFAPVVLAPQTAACAAISFDDSSSVEGCFPPRNPSSGVGTLFLSGPSIQLLIERNVPVKCSFSNGATIVDASVQAGGQVLECGAPPVDVAAALVAGTDPAPFQNFAATTALYGTIIDSHTVGPSSFDFSKSLCTAMDPLVQPAPWCWRNTTGADLPVAFWRGDTLDEVYRIARERIAPADALEFSCEYRRSGVAAPQHSLAVASVEGAAQTVQVTCAPPPTSLFELPTSEGPVTLTVSLRVRGRAGAPTRGWWTVGLQKSYVVSVSPCLAPLTPEPFCLGESARAVFRGEGLTHIVEPLQAACRFVGFNSGQAVGLMLPRVQGNGEVSCETFTSSRVKYSSVSLVAQNRDVATANLEASQRFCADVEFTSAFYDDLCWQAETKPNLTITVTGTTVASFLDASTGPFVGRLTVQNAGGSEDTLEIAPSSKELVGDGTGRVTLDFTDAILTGLRPRRATRSGTLQLLVVADGESSLVPITTPTFQSFPFVMRSCVQREKFVAIPGLPSCSPDCCAQSNASRTVLLGPGASRVESCRYASDDFIGDSAPVVNGTCTFVERFRPDSSQLMPDRVSLFDGAGNLVDEIVVAKPDQACVSTAFDESLVAFGTPITVRLTGPTFDALIEAVNEANAEEGTNTTTTLECRLSDAAGNPTVSATLVNGVCVSKPIFSEEEAANLELVYRTQVTPTRRRRLADESVSELKVFSKSLSEAGILVGPQIALELPLPECYQTGESLTLTLKGPGAVAVSSGVSCSFASVFQKAVLSTDNTTLTCASPPTAEGELSLPYSVVYERPDNLARSTIASGELVHCNSTAPPSVAGTNPVEVDKKLSGGDIAGIVIGCILFILLLLLLFFCLRRRKQRQEAENNKEDPAKGDAEPQADEENQLNKGLQEAPSSEPLPAANSAENNNNTVVIDAEEDFRPQADNAQAVDDSDLTNSAAAVGGAAPPPEPKYAPGSWVQVRLRDEDGEEMDDENEWALGVVSGHKLLTATNELEYLVADVLAEDKRKKTSVRKHVQAAEEDVRWPEYVAGNHVEILAADSDTWVPDVVASVDVASGTLRTTSASSNSPIAFARVRPGGFRVGDHVEEFGSDKEWRPAVVTATLPGEGPDGLLAYRVDGPSGSGIERSRQRLRWPSYKGGDIVEVRSGPSAEWEEATVISHEGLESLLCAPTSSINPQLYKFRDVRPKKAVVAAAAAAASFDEPERTYVADAATLEPWERRLKLKPRAPISSTLLPHDQYELTVDSSQGLGISVGYTKGGIFVIDKFKDLPNGDWGPIEASLLARLCDHIISVNDVDLEHISMVELGELITKSPNNRVKLKCGRPTKAQLQEWTRVGAAAAAMTPGAQLSKKRLTTGRSNTSSNLGGGDLSLI